MKRLITLLALMAMTAACGGPSTTLAKASVQEEGWRPLYTYNDYRSDFIFIIACREATSTVHALLVTKGGGQVITVEDEVQGATCDPGPKPNQTDKEVRS